VGRRGTALCIAALNNVDGLIDQEVLRQGVLERDQTMTDKSCKPVWGITPGRYGIVSLIAACLVYLCWPLILVLGLFLVLCIEVPLVLIAVAAGTVGLVTGAIDKDWIGVSAAVMGLSLIGLGAWLFSGAMNF